MKYRSDIDGLRAIAVLPVIFFHAGFNAFSGGYVGVDIFFVISGYLITSILITEYSENRFSISGFYLRRAKRILPALFCVIILSFPFAWIWFLPSDMKDFSQSTVATIAFVSNFFFWLKTGYFDIEAEFKPLLHTWSLAVEEQYYLFFPFVLYILCIKQNKLLIKTLVSLLLISLAISQWGSTQAPSANFFLFPSRLWELLLGAVTATYLSKSSVSFSPNKTIRELISAFGITLILFAIFGLNKETPYPSIYTLLPTIGTVLIIIFSDNDVLTGKILSHRALVGVGILSYSAYLWHQPLFAFSRYRTLGELSLTSSIALIFATFFLAYLTWELVEKPVRHKTKTKSFIIVFSCLAGVILFIGFWGHSTNGFSQIRSFKNLPKDYIQNTSVDRKLGIGIDGKHCISNHASMCQVSYFGSQHKSILLLGDSHSADFTNQFRKYAIENKLNAWQMSITGCAYVLSQLVGNSECKKAKSLVLDMAKQHQLDKIIVVGNYFFHTLHKSESDQLLDSATLINFIEQLLNLNVTVTFFIPRANFNYSPIRAASLDKLKQLKIEKNEKNEKIWMSKLKPLNKYKDFQLFDQDKILLSLGCGAYECFNGHSQLMTPLYRDSNHLTEIGSNLIFNAYSSN